MELPNLIQKTWIINKNITRIGLSNSLNYNINRSLNVPVLFIPKKCVIENIGKEVAKNQVIASLYNEVTRCEYLLFSPIKGHIINKNETILNNLDTIYINKTRDNWFVDIEHETKLNCKYHWFY